MSASTLPHRAPFRAGAILRATRGDMRASRQILAELGYGDTGPALDRVIAGPLENVTRFLAGCRVCFILIAWDESGRRNANGGHTAESVRELVTRLLCSSGDGNDRARREASAAVGPAVEHSAASDLADDHAVHGALAADFAALRLPWIESALGVLVDGLRDREVGFLLAWQLPGESQARLDVSLGADRGMIEDYLRWFVRDRLESDVPVTAASAPATGVPSP